MGISSLTPLNPTMIDLFTTPIAVCFITKPPINTNEINYYTTGNFLRCQTLVKNFMVGEKSIKIEKTLENLQWKQFSLAVGDGSTGGSQFQISFTEDSDASVTNTFLLLHKYMNSVITGSGTYIPKQADIDNNIIDYAMSMYVLLLKPNLREVIGFCKVQNMILSSVPMDIFSFDRTVIDAKFPSVNFITDSTKLNEEYILTELGDLLGTGGSLFSVENGGYVLSESFKIEILRYIGTAELNMMDTNTTTNTIQSNITDSSGNNFLATAVKGVTNGSSSSKLKNDLLKQVGSTVMGKFNVQENLSSLAKNIFGDPNYKIADKIVSKAPTYLSKALKFL